MPMASAAASVAEEPEIFFVSRRALEALREQLRQGDGKVDGALVGELARPEDLPDDEVMVPVDMRGAGGVYDDVAQLVRILGPRGAAEAFARADDYFRANKDGEPAEDRLGPVTALEWREAAENDDSDEGGEDSDEGALDEAEGAVEPGAKRARPC
mmetsp:Transcript_45937/g.121455  ORF Transcript_45937/g.121455 Transcript_45937/m.121455 type:complete len:156 (-) Transcript_45937:7-474(-)